MRIGSTCVPCKVVVDVTGEGNRAGQLAIALLHYPVYDKNRQVVATALTNLDVHDIARLAKTYGLVRYYVVTPLAEQRAIAHKIARHWQSGFGAEYNPKRKAALDLVTVLPSLDEAVTDMESSFGMPVRLIATGAKSSGDAVSFIDMAREMDSCNSNYLLLLGTGWGLTDEVSSRAHFTLAPIVGYGEYNHLSVRSAAAIMVDRLLGERYIKNQTSASHSEKPAETIEEEGNE